MARRELGDLLDYFTGTTTLAREADSYADLTLPYRVFFSVLTLFVFALALLPTAGGLSGPGTPLRLLVFAAVMATEPFLWNLFVRDRSHLWAYVGLVVLNLMLLEAFFLLQPGDRNQAFYFLIALAAFDFAADAPLINRAIPLAILLSLTGVLPLFSAGVAAALFAILVLREFRVYFQRQHHHRTLESLRDEVRRAKDAGHRDELTQLYNRSILTEQVQDLFAYCQEMGLPFGLIFFDIDHLKTANDKYGHPFGDEVISQVASLLMGTMRPEDFAIRFGGDELLLITTSVSSYAALRSISERIRERVRGTMLRDFTVTLSVGCMLFPASAAVDLQDVIRKADHALYAAKRRGRDRVVCYCDEEALDS